MSQTNEILDHLKRNKSITAMEALEKYGCFRLAARILDLKKAGHNIHTEMTVKNDKHYATYQLIGENK